MQNGPNIFTLTTVYLDHRAGAHVHCSDPDSENEPETCHFQTGLKVALVDPIECFGSIHMNQGATEASSSHKFLINVSH